MRGNRTKMVSKEAVRDLLPVQSGCFRAIPEQFDVRVQFKHFKSIGEIRRSLNFARSRNIVLWYIGCYGLKKSCADFYREQLIQPLLAGGYFSKFWLVDLTAWFGLKDRRGSILKDSRICDDIEQLGSSCFEVIRSSETFRKIKNFSHGPLVAMLRESIESDFVANNSAASRDSGIAIRDVFGTKDPLMAPYLDKDTSKCYSLLQYAEGCFIIQTILERTLSEQPVSHGTGIDIQFVLPNDEYKYYFDANSTFQQDVHYMVAYTCRLLGVDSASVNIEFLIYPFGDDLSKRPYNGTKGDRSLKHINFSDLAGLEKPRVRL